MTGDPEGPESLETVSVQTVLTLLYEYLECIRLHRLDMRRSYSHGH